MFTGPRGASGSGVVFEGVEQRLCLSSYSWPALGGAAVADFTGDGLPDLFVRGQSGFEIVAAKNDGTFAAPVAVSGYSGGPFAAGNFAGSDENADLLTFVRRKGLVVLPGDGKGGFGAAVTVSGVPKGMITVADVNKDGNSDLLVQTMGRKGEINVLIGKGDGTFAAPLGSAISAPFSTILATGDFDGNGNADILLKGLGWRRGTSLLSGNGDGTFNAATPVTGISGTLLATAKFTATDGNTADQLLLQGKMQWWRIGRGRARMRVPTYVIGTIKSGALSTQNATNVAAWPVAAADFNGDGNADLLIGNRWSGLKVQLGVGDGSFKDPAAITI